MATPQTAVAPQAQGLVTRIANRFGVEPNKMLATLKATAFRTDKEVTNEQMMALLVVAEQYHLNPFTKELYAFPAKGGGVVPIVGLDGWARIINEQSDFDGVEFSDGPLNDKQLPEWIECRIHRKSRAHPTTTREYMAECKRSTEPWGSHPRRMLRHKSLIQCARIAFGFVGIYDEDEGQRIVEGTVINYAEASSTVSAINQEITGSKPPIDATVTQEPTKPKNESPTYTLAQVTDAMNKAIDLEVLNDAATLIPMIDSAVHQEEAQKHYLERKAALTKE